MRCYNTTGWPERDVYSRAWQMGSIGFTRKNTMRVASGVFLVMLAQGLTGCGGPDSPSAPSLVSPVSQPAPPSTQFQITGIVLDTANRAVVGASVEVLTGPQAGTSTTSDAAGAFSLTGKFDGTTQFRASKAGHIAATKSFNSFAVAAYLSFLLEVLDAPVNISGHYSVTFVADVACADRLPSEVRTRTYSATVAADSSSSRPASTLFIATLNDASLDAYFHRMAIYVAGDYLDFDLSDNSLLEEVAPETYLGIGGMGAASVGTSGVSTISASFQGLFDYSGESVPHAQCQSMNHRLTLTRQ
jgi:Carboxypeptidase regulatory-like domain